MTSRFFMMCQSPAALKSTAAILEEHSKEHLNAEFETAPALPALTQLVTLGSHPQPGESSVETVSCDRTVTLPMAQMLLTGKINPSK